MKNKLLLLIIILISNSIYYSQYVKGKIVDQNNLPIDNVTISNSNSGKMTKSTSNGNYRFELEEGYNELTIYCAGCDTLFTKIDVKLGENNYNFQLNVNYSELNEIEFVAKKTNVGKEIVKKVIEKNNYYDNNYNSITYNLLIKSIDNSSINKTNKDDYSTEVKVEQEKETEKIQGGFLEYIIKKEFQKPNNHKEIFEAKKTLGDSEKFFFKNSFESNIDFSKPIINLPTLTKTPLISPISNHGLISYKYKLKKIEENINGSKSYYVTIKGITNGNSTFSGMIIINDSGYYVEKYILNIDKDALIQFDYFNIEQTNRIIDNKYNIIDEQKFEYGLNRLKSKTKNRTYIKYSDYKFNMNFPPKYFSDEIGIVKEDAYNKDIEFWNTNSSDIQLDSNDNSLIQKLETKYEYINSTRYLDSIDSVSNAITFGKVMLFGINNNNHIKKRSFNINSITTYLLNNYNVFGFNYGLPAFNYTKKQSKEQLLSINLSKLNYNKLNNFYTYNIDFYYRFNSLKSRYIKADIMKGISPFAVVDVLDYYFDVRNYSNKNLYQLSFGSEIINGLNSAIYWNYVSYKSLNGYKIDENIKKILYNSSDYNFLDFEKYTNINIGIMLQYTPFQKYIKDRYKKVILGSKWPSLYTFINQTIPSNNINTSKYSKLELGINHEINVYTFGVSTYNIIFGKFLNKDKLNYIDYNFFSYGSKFFISSLMHSLQALPKTIITSDDYIKVFYNHHFNGAIMNKIPLLNKLRLSTVVGANYLNINAMKVNHFEYFGGIERIFKFPNIRMRIGVYYTDAISSEGRQKNHFKFAINIYSFENKSWGY